MSAVGDPEQAFPSVHITGTNGKGSTSRFVTALFLAKGLSVGTYLSPDLEFLNERILKNGVPIPDADLQIVLNTLASLEDFVTNNATQHIAPTWFELVTACGFCYFADEAVDAAVIEVGLGGRYDATNVVDGVVAAITNVELDHVEILGPTRADIAAEKAGIIKMGAHVMVGDLDPDIVAIFEREARAVGAESVSRRGIEFDCESNLLAHGGRLVELRTPRARYDEVYLPMFGAHQGDNAAIALATAEAFFGEPFDEDVVAEAFSSVVVPGRVEVVARRPLVIVDGAHNVAGAAALARALDEDFATAKHIIVVMGCLRGRDPGELIDALRSDRLSHLIACSPVSLRSLPASVVAEASIARGIPTDSHDEIADALEAALALANEDDLIVVTGSLKAIAPARHAARRLSSVGP